MNDEHEHVILSAAKDLKLRIWRSFAVYAAQDDVFIVHRLRFE